MDVLSTLTAISPIDGRYRPKVSQLAEYFSEFSLIRYRIHVEVEYLIALCHVVPFRHCLAELSSHIHAAILREIYAKENFTEKEAQKIKQIENEINHDVKAVEYFLKEKFDELGWGKQKEWIHFGLTSQDINNTAIPLQLKVISILIPYNPSTIW